MIEKKRKPNPDALARRLRKASYKVAALAAQISALDGSRYASSVEGAATALSEAAAHFEGMREKAVS